MNENAISDLCDFIDAYNEKGDQDLRQEILKVDGTLAEQEDLSSRELRDLAEAILLQSSEALDLNRILGPIGDLLNKEAFDKKKLSHMRKSWEPIIRLMRARLVDGYPECDSNVPLGEVYRVYLQTKDDPEANYGEVLKKLLADKSKVFRLICGRDTHFQAFFSD